MACPIITRPNQGWMTDALSRRLLSKDTGPPQVESDVSAWLSDIRYSVHEYDERNSSESNDSKDNKATVTVKTDSSISSDVSKFIKGKILNGSDLLKEEEEDEFSNAFDEILSNLGNEIYKLDSYKEKHFPDAAVTVQDLSGIDDSFMEIFDDCLQCIRASTPSPEGKADRAPKQIKKNMEMNLHLNLPLVNKIASFGNISTLSDEVFLNNSRTPSRDGSNVNVNIASGKNDDEVVIRREQSSQVPYRHASFDINRIFDKGQGAPVPPRRKYRQTNPFPSEHSPRVESRPLSKIDLLRAKFDNKDSSDAPLRQIRNGSCSDSGNNSSNSTSDYSDYQNLWLCSSGGRKPAISPAVKTFIENYGSENTIRYDSLRDISNSSSDISKEKMVQACCKRSRSGSAKTESETESPARLLSVPLEGARNARHSYDGRKQPEVVAIRLSERDMIKCTSECDMSDDCHRSLHTDDTSGHHYVNCDVYKDSFGKQHNIFSTVPRVDKKIINAKESDVVSLPENIAKIEQFNSDSNLNIEKETQMGKAYESRAERRGTNNSCGSDLNTSDLKDSALECCDEWVSDTASACGTDLLNANAADEDWSSVEIISDADSLKTPPWGRWRTPSDSTAGASESPVYENLRDVRAAVRQRPPPPDVAAWKAALLDPYCNEDEEDEV